jgi:sensor histidine kinase regulating citrate/malate metabolism
MADEQGDPGLSRRRVARGGSGVNGGGRADRADTSRSYEEGTGLGLAIAKWIADIHPATLTAESVEGCGTTFRVLFQPAA